VPAHPERLFGGRGLHENRHRYRRGANWAIHLPSSIRARLFEPLGGERVAGVYVHLTEPPHPRQRTGRTQARPSPCAVLFVRLLAGRLVDEDGDAVADRLRVDEPQALLVALW
jgi:hypothetical protein